MKKSTKIYISVDMEGMAGITSPSQERDEVPSFQRFTQSGTLDHRRNSCFLQK